MRRLIAKKRLCAGSVQQVLLDAAAQATAERNAKGSAERLAPPVETVHKAHMKHSATHCKGHQKKQTLISKHILARL